MPRRSSFANSASISGSGVRPLEPAVLEPHGVAIVVEGMRVLVLDRGVGEVDEASEARHHDDRGEPRQEPGARHPGSRTSSTSAAAWRRSWVRLTSARAAPSLASRARARALRCSHGGPCSPRTTSTSSSVTSPPSSAGGGALGAEARREPPLGVDSRTRVGQLALAEDARRIAREQRLDHVERSHLDGARDDTFVLRAFVREVRIRHLR